MDRRSLLLPAFAFVLGLVALAGAAYLTFAPQREETRASAVGGPFTLTASTGERVNNRQFEGAPMLVFFGFTNCPDICPTKLLELSEMFRAAGDKAGRARALFITVDPERDTPEVLKSYLSSFDPRIVGLTGTRDEIDAVIKTYRAFSRRVPTSNGGYTMDHTAIVYLVDKRGRFVGAFSLERPPQYAAQELLRHL